MNDDDDDLELEIPSEPEYVAAARLFLAAVGRHYELDEECVADMKVVVSEVCTAAAEDLQRPEALRIAVRPGPDALSVVVRPAGREPEPVLGGRDGGAPLGPSSWEQALREPLVQALFPDARYQADAHTLEITVPRALSAGPAATP